MALPILMAFSEFVIVDASTFLCFHHLPLRLLFVTSPSVSFLLLGHICSIASFLAPSFIFFLFLFLFVL